MSPGKFHPENVTWQTSPGKSHLLYVTWKMSPGKCHLETVTYGPIVTHINGNNSGLTSVMPLLAKYT